LLTEFIWLTAYFSEPLFRLAALVGRLPAHLGWGSAPVTAAARVGLVQRPKGTGGNESDRLVRPASVQPGDEAQGTGRRTTPQPGTAPAGGQVRLYPSIGLGMLQQEMAAPGRLWLMLRYLDEQGQGSLRIVSIHQHLTTKQKPLRLCGKRQLRNLLKQGEGVFWSRDPERLWLYSAARVAQALGVERLSGHPVALPVRVLLDGMGTVPGPPLCRLPQRPAAGGAHQPGRTGGVNGGIRPLPAAL
jgi:hypothetical protein